MSPSPNGKSGRDPKGRFLTGNPGGPGNPLAKSASQLRSMLLTAVSADDVRAIVKKLVEQARAGEPWAIKELLDRMLGRPQPAADPSGDFTPPPTIIVNVVGHQVQTAAETEPHRIE
jgi:hypothetical protein